MRCDVIRANVHGRCTNDAYRTMRHRLMHSTQIYKIYWVCETCWSTYNVDDPRSVWITHIDYRNISIEPLPDPKDLI